MSIILINPPVAKACEPPAGLARLAGTLRSCDVPCRVIDLNVLCLHELLLKSYDNLDTWSRRAVAKRCSHLKSIRNTEIYRQPDRYRQAVNDLNRVLSLTGRSSEKEISLVNYQDRSLSPLVSSDLLTAADRFFESPFLPVFKSSLKEVLEEINPDFIGISIVYLSQALSAFALIGYIRKAFPSLKVIVGGGLITSWMSNRDWQDPFSQLVDHCIAGPGEQALLSLFGQRHDRSLGVYDYDDLRSHAYLAPGFILPYAASAGCYWKKCTFCPDRAEDTPYVQHSPADGAAEIRSLVARYDPVIIHLLDNAVNPALLEKLAVSPPGAAWYGFSRFEAVLENPEFCRELRRSGCVMLKLGLESGSQRVLDYMCKGIRLEKVARILDNLERAGIATYVYLLFGTPRETEKEALETLQFVRENHRAVTYLNTAIFNMPVCGSEAASVAGRFSTGDLSLYCDFEHPAGWDRKSVRRFLADHFRKDRHVRAILRRDPPFFTSNHAPLFSMFNKPGGPNG